MGMTTAYMVAERRLMDSFAAEMEALGLKAHTTGISGSYREDGVFVAQFQTEPEPVKGNRAKMEALRAAGYTVEVYAPYNWNRRRAFVVWVSRPVIITDADREIAGYGIMPPLKSAPGTSRVVVWWMGSLSWGSDAAITTGLCWHPARAWKRRRTLSGESALTPFASLSMVRMATA